MDTRKTMKANAKKAFKKHYVLYIVICFMAALLGAEFTNEIGLFKQTDSSKTSSVSTYAGAVSENQNLYDVIVEDYNKKKDDYNSSLADEDESKMINQVLGHRRGVLASVVNGVSSGSFVTQIILALRSMTGSSNVTAVLFIFGSLLVSFLFWFFIKNTFQVVVRRLYLEGRQYDKISMQRFLFLIRVKKLPKAAVTMFVLSIYELLWSLTIVGGWIKHYSYLLVPYIVAENPGISTRAAIKLSRKMMNGHKWEYFVNDITFMGWFILGTVTFGLSDLFFTNSYRTAYFAECYMNLRNEAKNNNIENADLMYDKYLYEYADDELLEKEYHMISELINEAPEEPEEISKGFRGFIAKWFGISFFSKEINDRYADYQVKNLTIKKYKAELEKKSYPTRLYPIPEKLKNPRVANINYMRLYSVTSVILLFFSFCIIGWLWEVSLHLISDGEFVNRGVLHGPWLPIYGMGGVLILIILTKLRKKPAFEFAAAVVLCGMLEYFTAWHLEMTHGGTKWWDYSGYFLNLHGRICAEGLLIFGVGGCAIVYFVAPMFDNLFKKINKKVAITVCAILIVLYTGDQIYSSKHPNIGKGITDYTASSTVDIYRAGNTVDIYQA